MRILFFFFSVMICNLAIGQKGLDAEVQNIYKSGTHYEFDKTFVELGDVKKGEKRIFDFTMKNTGTDHIKISYVSYCDCTTVDYMKSKELKSGESMVFDVVFDSSTKEEEETIEIEMELENKDKNTGLPIYLTLDYHFKIVK